MRFRYWESVWHKGVQTKSGVFAAPSCLMCSSTASPRASGRFIILDD